jgi:hypothetical protein
MPKAITWRVAVHWYQGTPRIISVPPVVLKMNIALMIIRPNTETHRGHRIAASERRFWRESGVMGSGR